MVSKRKKLVATAAIIMCAAAALSMTSPGRAALNRIFSTEAPPSIPQTSADLEQRVRTRHGWNTTLLNSVVSGEITYYGSEGQQHGQASFVLYRAYPNRMRVVISRGGSVETIGFDQTQAWKLGRGSLSEPEARDIRAWFRLWPERLFTTRASGAAYRETGRRTEDSRPATPWQGSSPVEPPALLQQIEIKDTIGAAPDGQRAGDRRSVSYYIDQSSLLIKSARWLEPDDPRVRPDDARAAKMDCRVDFGNWLQMGGVMWPMQITRWRGGKVESRIEVGNVLVNQPLTDSLFQAP